MTRAISLNARPATGRRPRERETPARRAAPVRRPAQELVEFLLHRVADENQRAHLSGFRRAHRVTEHARDLGLAADAGNGAHGAMKRRRRRQPPARLALVETAIEDQLHLEAAQARGGLEHFPLQATGAVPARPAAGRRVHGEDQPPAPAHRPRRRHRRDLAQEGVHCRGPARCRNGTVALPIVAHAHYMGADPASSPEQGARPAKPASPRRRYRDRRRRHWAGRDRRWSAR